MLDSSGFSRIHPARWGGTSWGTRARNRTKPRRTAPFLRRRGGRPLGRDAAPAPAPPLSRRGRQRPRWPSMSGRARPVAPSATASRRCAGAVLTAIQTAPPSSTTTGSPSPASRTPRRRSPPRARVHGAWRTPLERRARRRARTECVPLPRPARIPHAPQRAPPTEISMPRGPLPGRPPSNTLLNGRHLRQPRNFGVEQRVRIPAATLRATALGQRVGLPPSGRCMVRRRTDT